MGIFLYLIKRCRSFFLSLKIFLPSTVPRIAVNLPLPFRFPYFSSSFTKVSLPSHIAIDLTLISGFPFRFSIHRFPHRPPRLYLLLSTNFYSANMFLPVGTAFVVLAWLVASLKLLGGTLGNHTFLFLGAGEAGTGIAELIALEISKQTKAPLEESRKKI